jgi:undecaprenyl-diphosphatase
MFDFDSRVLHALYGGAQGPWGPAMTALTIVGSGWTAFALLPLLAWPRTRLVASALALAILVQATAVWALKLAIGRVRPWIALGLAAPPGAPHDASFPSGHAAGSFCVAAFLVVVLPSSSPILWRGRVVSATAVVLATLISASRIYLGAHYPTDVIAGALLGSLVGAAAAKGHLHRSLTGSGDEKRARPVGVERPTKRR